MNESSREKLDMDLGEQRYNHRNNGRSNDLASHLTFNHYKGVYVKRWILFLIVLIFISLLVALGLLIGYLVACKNERDTRRPQTPDTSDSSVAGCATCGKRPYVRLPRSVVPISYDVQLQPFLRPDLFYFDGNVSIRIHCTEPTDNVTLHINDITIHNETVKIASLKSDNSLELDLEAKYLERDLERQFFIIRLSRPLEASKNYTVSMRYNGTLNQDLVGFYRSSYEENNEKRWLAATQFEPTDARRAFPCFDEPALKATFKISIIHWSNMTALSNMPVESSVKSGEWVTDTFQETVRMSTYLLAFVVGDLESAKAPNSKPEFAVWTRKAQSSTAEYALSIGPKILQHYEKFYNVAFPLPKTDMVAVPDFNAGAMENWGLILYRETAMLYDPKISSIFNKERVATVVAHELAHQWFGNLVTPKWWDDLWLNEGFASYVEYEGVDSVHPEWKMHHQFVSELQDVFELDCLNTSHPISVKVGHPDEINEIFDRISYAKGAAIIRMMNYILGSDTFRTGVSSYLKALMFKNAEQDDLWHYLTIAQNESADSFVDVKKVMDSWTLQAGYPVLTLERNYEQKTAKVVQKRFLLNAEVEKELLKTETRRWEVPVSYTSAKEKDWTPTTRLWLTKDKETVDIPKEDVPTSDQWMIANLQEVGFYRVNYDVTNWNLLVDQLMRNYTEIHAINRAQIMDDLLDLAKAGYVSYGLALNATKYLTLEQELLPWDAASSGISFLDKMLRRTNLYGKWKKYIKKLLRPVYEKYRWQITSKDDLLQQSLQHIALSWTCGYEDEACIKEAQDLFEKWRSSKGDNPIEPNFRYLVYCTAIKHGNEDEWDFVWEQYLKSKVASEGDKLMRALACARQPWLLERYLSWVLNDTSRIRRQDGSSVFRNVALNDYGRDIANGFMKENWQRIVLYFGKSMFSFGNIIKSVTSCLTSDYELEQLKNFYKSVTNNLGTSRRSFQQAIEKVEANVQWMKKHYLTIQTWLNNNYETL